MDDLKENLERYPSSYWANTSSNSIVRSLIDQADDETKSEIETLIEDKTVKKPIHEDITYEEMYDSMDNLWNFMFFAGYFRKACQWADSDGHQYAELAIPNRESGYGRSDLILQPITRRKAAFVLKFKIAKSFSELRKKAQEALWQIEEKQYQQELNNDGYAVVHKYGIAFFGKDCLVRLGTENEDSE